MRMRALQIRCTSQEASVGCLKAHQASDKEKITQYKEAMQTLNAESKAQKARITELEKNACRVEELTKENSNLMTKLAALFGMWKGLRPMPSLSFKCPNLTLMSWLISLLKGFKHFHKQAILLFPNFGLDFHQVQINLSVSSTTLGGGEVIVDDVVDLEVSDGNG